jgi:hypothetical protein
MARSLVPPLLVLALVTSCSSGGGAPTVLMRFDRAAGFFTAPFPSDDLRRADGTIAIAGFPNPDEATIVAQATSLVAQDARGFAVSGGVFFALTGPIDPARLPGLAGSTAAAATVFLVSVDPAAPDSGRRYPVYVSFAADGGPYGAPNLLALLPLQGVPLRPLTTYAAVVRRSLGVGAGPEMTALAAGEAPAALPAAARTAYQSALAALAAGGVAASEIAGLAVFTTGDPTAEMAEFRAHILAQPRPTPSAPFQQTEVFDDYCVYETSLGLPDYQGGTPPFSNEGGGWTRDAAGQPEVQRIEEARLIVTVPRAAMPTDGYPTTVFVRTGGGGDRPIIERGVHPSDGSATQAGSGPAMRFARAGFAGVQVDGPLGGLRNLTHSDEQFLMFNIFNGLALRDNTRESALELILLAHLLDDLAFDASDCPGAGAVRFDSTRLALMGHSMGATIAPLVLAHEPRYGAAVLSGAGGSWIENILYKQKPLEVRPPIELLIGYPSRGLSLTRGDPVLTLIQWAEEPADPQVYARRVVAEPAAGEAPRHVLMLQGIVDHYIMPPIADGISLALGLDLAGTALDSQTPEVADLAPLGPLLPLVGRGPIALPASGNVVVAAGTATAVVVQHPEDGFEDGHEVVFQTAAPQHQYRCFLASFAAGTPVVPAGADADAPCL